MDLVKRYRKSINPPYSPKDYITLGVTFFILLAILLSTIATQNAKDLRSNANSSDAHRRNIKKVLTFFDKPLETNVNALAYNNWSNLSQLSGKGPIIARAVVLNKADYETQYNNQINLLETLKSKGNPDISGYAVVFGSVDYATTKLIASEATRLKNIGVTAIKYNPESGNTPDAEFAAKYDDNDNNPIVRFAQLAENNGFQSIWVPIRYDSTNYAKYTDSLLARIYGHGLDGLDLQEQTLIENQCVASRIPTVDSTFSYHEQRAGKTLIKQVQVMSSRCANGDSYAITNCTATEKTGEYTYQHCDQFSGQLESRVNSLSIWASNTALPYDDIPRLPGFITELRKVN